MTWSHRVDGWEKWRKKCKQLYVACRDVEKGMKHMRRGIMCDSIGLCNSKENGRIERRNDRTTVNYDWSSRVPAHLKSCRNPKKERIKFREGFELLFYPFCNSNCLDYNFVWKNILFRFNVDWHPTTFDTFRWTLPVVRKQFHSYLVESDEIIS